MEKIKTLTEEWRKRDKEREILTKEKVTPDITAQVVRKYALINETEIL